METFAAQGLTQYEAQHRLDKNGENKIETSSSTPLLRLFVTQYMSVITLILVLAALFSLFIQEYVDAGFIFFILFSNSFFGFIQEYRAERAIEALADLSVPVAKVIRDGVKQEIEAVHLVEGDTVVLEEGDRIPADGTLLAGIHIEVDEAIFTGESLPVFKKKNDELYTGTFVVRGRGHMIVTQTGLATKLGQIASEMHEIKKPKTPLALNIEQLGKILAFSGMFFSFVLIPIGLFQGRELAQLILTTVSLAVAVIPEGLPLVVTIALAVGAHRMVKQRTITRKMSAIETLGSTSIILSDKTGTLTQNKMSVKKIYIPNAQKMSFIIRACLLGNTATLALKEDGGEAEIVGDKTDGALLSFAHKKLSSMLDEFLHEGKLLSERPFDPKTKIIETKWQDKNNNMLFFERGAPETILARCTKVSKKKAEKHVATFAKEGLRVIAFSYKKAQDKNFTFAGLLAIYDPPRVEAKDALLRAKKAGIRVVMVTGDNPVTALSIGEEIGLVSEGDVVLTSREIQKMPDEELSVMLPKVRIFARMQPHDKLRLVRLYKRARYVVAVTGDGVNDALALAEAHIGVAMGATGTDVAKEAADIVITDDNLATIVKAIEEGRGIFDNVVKSLVFLIGSNLIEFLVIALAVAFGLPIPFTPTQILWVNLVSDGLPALALATDVKKSHLLSQKPRDTKEHILNGKRLRFIAYLALPFAMITLLVFTLLLQYFPEGEARFLLFNLFVVAEMGVVFIVRGGIFPLNRFLFLAVYLSLMIQLFIFLSPFARELFS